MEFDNRNLLCSVIIPTFNSAETIIATLDSVFVQDYTPIEIIVVDDFSSDDTIAKVSKFKNVKVIALKQNKGVSNARNVGFKASKGFFIQFLDSDDQLMLGKLSKQIGDLLQTKADVSIANWVEFRSDLNTSDISLKYNRQIDNVADLKLACIKDFWSPLCSIIYTRKSIERITWNEELRIVQDARFLFDVLNQNQEVKVIFNSDFLGRYRRNTSNSLSSCDKVSFVDDCFLNVMSLYNELKQDNKMTRETLESIFYVLSHLVVEYSVLKNRQKHREVLDFLNDIDNDYIHYKNRLLLYFAKRVGYLRTEKFLFYLRFRS